MIVTVPDFTVDVIKRNGRAYIDASDLRHWLAESLLANDDEAVRAFSRLLRDCLARVS